MPRIKVTPKQGQKTVIGARKGKGKKKVKNTEQNGKKQESRVVRKSTENVQEQTASGSTVSRKKKETASGSNSRRVGSDGVNSKSKKRKRVRSMGSGSTEEVKDREEGGGEGNEMKRRKVKEVRISDTTVAKWKPVSLATRKLLNDTMFTALGGCLDGVKGSNKRTTEAILQQVIKRVENGVTAAVAPTTKRVKSNTDLKHRVTELKEKCIELVKKNEEMEQKLEERKLFCDERRQNIQQLEESFQQPTQHHSITSPSPSPPQSADGEGDNIFVDYIHNLMSHNSFNSTNTLSQQNIIF